jgi:hypothetical protein
MEIPSGTVPEPIPLPLDALLEVESEVTKAEEASIERPALKRTPIDRNSSDGQQLARVALQRKSLPRKESKYGNAAVEKSSVKHVDHSGRSIPSTDWPATENNSKTEEDDNVEDIILSIDDIVIDD